jgi:hypothetical protein
VFPPSRLIKPLLLLRFASLVGASPALAENVRVKVTEVKGVYCKLNGAAPEGIAVGAAGKLYRLSAGISPQGEVTITSVQADYSVGKVAGGTAEVGDFVLLPKSDVVLASPAAKTEATTSAKSAQAEMAEEDGFDDLVGKSINILLEDDKLLEDVKLIRVARDTKTGQLKTLRVEGSEPNSAITLELSKLKEVTFEGESIELPEVVESSAKSGLPKTRNQLLSERRNKREAEEHKAWLARIKAKGIEPWPELTQEEHQAAIDASKAIVEQVKKAYQNIQLHETKQFLFCTNIPPEQCGPYVLSLDKMHDMMCQMYNIKKGTPVWKGKALVIAFLTQEEFMDFERKFMQTNLPSTVYGVCHQKPNGDVLMACFRGERMADFGQMLVHETSHGFIHRYKTPVVFPNWVNEGMADYIGVAMVPCKSMRDGEKYAVLQMRLQRSMGGDFFTRRNISSWQYGVASTLADYMIRTDKKAYVKFIEGMKEGLSWEESLMASYKATPQQLVSSYGQAIGVPDLKP